MFLRKNSRIEKKKETHLQQLPQKNKPPTLIDQTPSRISTIVLPHLLITDLKREGAQRTKHKIVPRVFLHILVYVLEWKCLLCTRVEVKDTLYR